MVNSPLDCTWIATLEQPVLPKNSVRMIFVYRVILMQPIRRLHISDFGTRRQGGNLRSRPLPTITNVWRKFRLVLSHGSSLFLKLLKLFCCFGISCMRLYGQLCFFRCANVVILGRFVSASR